MRAAAKPSANSSHCARSIANSCQPRRSPRSRDRRLVAAAIGAQNRRCPAPPVVRSGAALLAGSSARTIPSHAEPGERGACQAVAGRTMSKGASLAPHPRGGTRHGLPRLPHSGSTGLRPCFRSRRAVVPPSADVSSAEPQGQGSASWVGRTAGPRIRASLLRRMLKCNSLEPYFGTLPKPKLCRAHVVERMSDLHRSTNLSNRSRIYAEAILSSCRNYVEATLNSCRMYVGFAYVD